MFTEPYALHFLRSLIFRLADFIQRIPKPLIIAVAYLYVFGWDLINFATGHELGFTIFYLPALFLLTWFVSVRSALLLALLTAVSWILIGVDLLAFKFFAHFWEAVFRFGVFAVFVYGTTAYKRERIFARQDFLTKIANSQHLTELAEVEIERCRRYGRPFSVVYMDIDNFKAINDTLGHRAGDELLYEVAQTIQKNIRSTDTAARLGGDEFAILLPETDAEHAAALVPKLQDILLDLMRERAWRCTFSMGVVTFLSPPATYDEMIHRADQLMYEAKGGGKDSVKSGVFK